jgi:hypothetical protein
MLFVFRPALPGTLVILTVSWLFDCYQLAASAAFVSSTRPATAARPARLTRLTRLTRPQPRLHTFSIAPAPGAQSGLVCFGAGAGSGW